MLSQLRHRPHLIASVFALLIAFIAPFAGGGQAQAKILEGSQESETNAPYACRNTTWTTTQNVTVQNNSIRKMSGLSATWDAGAVSTLALRAGTGYVVATVDDTSTYKLFGLSHGNSNANQGDVDFALFMAGGTLKVYESGVLKLNVGSYAVGDVLKVALESGSVIRYYRNATLVYTSTATPTLPLLLDTSINSLGGWVTNTQMCGTDVPVDLTPTPVDSTPTQVVSTPTDPPATATAANTNTPRPTSTRPPTTSTSTPTRVVAATATATPGSGGGPTLGGCPMFPANNIWNRNIASVPVHSQSDQFVNALGAGRTLHPGFGSGSWHGFPMGIPFTTVPGSQPLVPIDIYLYPGESDPGPARIPGNAPIEVPTDSHVSVLETGSCTLYEMYHATPVPDGSWAAGSTARYNMNSNNLRPDGWTSPDAAGFAILPGLVRYDEAAAGPIRHAVRFTGDVGGVRTSHVWPARHSDGNSGSSGAPPMGTRFRLKASVDISGYQQPLRNILQGLKDYGMFLADTTDPSDSWSLIGAPDSRWNTTMLNQMNNISGSDFEAVDESGLMVDPNSGQSR